jgi:hypothetical protein
LLGVAQVFVSFVPLLVVDGGLKLGQAYSTSIATARRHFWGLFGYLFVAGLVQLSGVIGCCIGVIFTIPFYYAMRAIVYNDLFRVDRPAETSEQATPPAYGSL